MYVWNHLMNVLNPVLGTIAPPCTCYMAHASLQLLRGAAHTETHRKVPCRCRENCAPASPHHPPRFFQMNFSDYPALEGKPAHCVCVYVHTARM